VTERAGILDQVSRRILARTFTAIDAAPRRLDRGSIKLSLGLSARETE
jgi:hypothetical protein